MEDCNLNGILLTSLAMLVGMCICTAVHHLWIGIRSPERLVYVVFGLLSFVVSLYVFSKLSAYRAVSVEELVAMRRWEIGFAMVFLGVLPWFAAAYTGVRRRVLLLGLSAYCLSLIGVNLIMPFGVSFIELPHLNYLTLPWGEQVVDLRVHQRSLWHNLSWIFLLSSFAYSIYACRIQYMQGERRKALQFASALIVFLLFTLFNYVVNLGLINFTHTAEFGFIALVLLMSAALSRDLRNNDAALETLRVQLEEQVRARTEELATNIKELETYSYSVSHDLRAPLRSINGFSSLLVEDHDISLNATAKHYLDRIHQATQHMNELINAMLELSRVVHAELHRSTVDLSALVHDACRRLREAGSNHAVNVIVAPGVTAQADPRLIAVVLDNLLSNAWKYSSRTENAQINFGADIRNGETIYFVKDNGAGFDMNYADKLFTPFQRLHSAKDFQGTGVGLATVARIVRRHGGRIWAQSEAGKGATFYFTMQ
ncbi:MAG: GHKL domain-containing protein [Gammaproteobacteria bacterium]|nr:GHKL domain-containing protein [Gammaproteobacteria bacterium]